MNEIVSQAKTWLNTKFHHQGRIKHCGVDCLGLIVGVARELNLLSRDGKTFLYTLDNINYGQFPNTKILYNLLSAHLFEMSKEDMKSGDIILMSIDNSPQHLGIVSDYDEKNLGIIHSYAPARKVVEHRLDEEWEDRIIGVFRVG